MTCKILTDPQQQFTVTAISLRRVAHDKKGRFEMIRKLKSGKYRLYSRKKDPKTGKRRNLGTFDTKEGAKQHEREVQFFKKK